MTALIETPRWMAAQAARPLRRWPYLIFTALVLAGAAAISVGAVDSLIVAASHPEYWLLAALTVVAGLLSFLVWTPNKTPVVICPTICITFAILMCWGLGPAILAQLVAILCVSAKLRLPPGATIITAAQYVIAFAAADAVLLAAHPDSGGGPANDVRCVAVVVVAAVAWLAAFSLVVYAGSRLDRLRHADPDVIAGFDPQSLRSPANADTIGYQVLFRSTLLLLSPVLALSAQFNVYTVPLILVPLYAVGRMARLSAERDRAVRADALTGLASRTELRRRFDVLRGRVRRREARSPGRIALLLLDLDRFKNINDALGHELGDQLLIAVAQRLENLQSRGATVARLGGDEFAILTAIRDTDEARRLGQLVVDELNQPIDLEGLRVDVGASVGIAELHGANEDFPTLMRDADAAMYDAKKQGATYSVYQRHHRHTTVQRLGLLADFRGALEERDERQLGVHYQPQLSLMTGQVVGVEALLRWDHPTHGPIPTAEILALAENTPVMPLLTRWVVEMVVAQQAAWQQQGVDVRLSLNVSVRDLFSDDIVSQLAASLAQHRVPAESMQIEITESALMADPARAFATVRRIAELGVSIALDDFGTGYSSLQHLRRLPVTELKIDASLIRGMSTNSDDTAIVRSTIEMARALNLRTVAEGVQDAPTYQFLADTHCTLAQGWHTGRPVPADVLTRRLLPGTLGVPTLATR